MKVNRTEVIPLCMPLENPFYKPWLRRIFANPAELKEGYLYTPSHPGLGMELDNEVLEKYRLA